MAVRGRLQPRPGDFPTKRRRVRQRRIQLGKAKNEGDGLLLRGPRLRLRPVELEDLPLLHRWESDPAMTGEFQVPRPHSLRELERRFLDSPAVSEEFGRLLAVRRRRHAGRPALVPPRQLRPLVARAEYRHRDRARSSRPGLRLRGAASPRGLSARRPAHRPRRGQHRRRKPRRAAFPRACRLPPRRRAAPCIVARRRLARHGRLQPRPGRRIAWPHRVERGRSA